MCVFTDVEALGVFGPQGQHRLHTVRMHNYTHVPLAFYRALAKPWVCHVVRMYAVECYVHVCCVVLSACMLCVYADTALQLCCTHHSYGIARTHRWSSARCSWITRPTPSTHCLHAHLHKFTTRLLQSTGETHTQVWSSARFDVLFNVHAGTQYAYTHTHTHTVCLRNVCIRRWSSARCSWTTRSTWWASYSTWCPWR